MQAKIDELTPKLNPLIVEGYSTQCMKNALSYIDLIFRCAQSGFPKGMKYLSDRTRVATPKEQYSEMIRKKAIGSRFETAENYLFLAMFYFEFEGEIIERGLFLPYLDVANIFKLRGSTYMLSPVLADNGLSVSSDHIFVALPRSKLTFFRDVHHIRVNGVAHVNTVAWSNFYNKKIDKRKKITSANPSLAHYLFTRFGLRGAFDKFTHITPVAIISGTDSEKYPPSKYVTCTTNGMRPRGWKSNVPYTPSKLSLIFNKKDFTPEVEQLTAGFFYVVDHWPDKFQIEYFFNEEDEAWLWRETLGNIHFPEDLLGKRIDHINTHMASVDTYVDKIAVDDLKREGIMVNDIYSLFYVILTQMSHIISTASTDVGTMYGKRLSVLYYALGKVKDMIFNFAFVLQRSDRVTAKSILDLMRNRDNGLRTHEGSNLLTSRGHGEVESVSYPGDNMAFKITTNLVLQKNATAAKSSDISVDSPDQHLHSSIAEIGSFMACPKSDPTGRSKLNPYVQLDPDGFVIRQEKFKPLLDEVQKNIRRN